MSEQFTYEDYVNDEGFLAEYNAYQERYASNIRESDKKIIELVDQHVKALGPNRPDVLDIGCSTGNLLLHLKQHVPNANYVGGDLAVSSLEECRNNPDLTGIAFEDLDILDLPAQAYDVVVVNAVLYMFDDDQYVEALASLHQSLRPNGRVIIYDFAHPFSHQNLTIYETSLLHPEGLRLCFRPMSRVRRAASEVGFAEVDFHPFELPIELPEPGHDEEVVTYTVNHESGKRMMFRGALFQPWCHMVMKT